MAEFPKFKIQIKIKGLDEFIELLGKMTKMGKQLKTATRKIKIEVSDG